jgi:hypothetical protein
MMSNLVVYLFIAFIGLIFWVAIFTAVMWAWEVLA